MYTNNFSKSFSTECLQFKSYLMHLSVFTLPKIIINTGKLHRTKKL